MREFIISSPFHESKYELLKIIDEKQPNMYKQRAYLIRQWNSNTSKYLISSPTEHSTVTTIDESKICSDCAFLPISKKILLETKSFDYRTSVSGCVCVCSVGVVGWMRMKMR